MPFYHGLKGYSPTKADWISRRLIALRSDLHRQITGPRRSNSLIIGSWNIRAFDGGLPRLDDSYHFIAEIISTFDICAVQEVKDDLAPLKRLRDLLGANNWDYFVTDASDHAGGNKERMAFFYNKNKVFFRNLVGEIVIDESQIDFSAFDDIDRRQLARSPFFAAFQAGWFRFTLVSAHIFFGKDDDRSKNIRAQEISLIGEKLIARAKKQDQVFIFLGDMNIDTEDGVVMQSLKETDMKVPGFGPANMDGSKYYDQMAYTDKGSNKKTRKTRELRHGVFDWRRAVYPYKSTLINLPEDHPDFYGSDPDGVHRPSFEESTAYYFAEHVTMREAYNSDKPASKQVTIKKTLADFRSGFNTWSTHQMSDHMPIWLELETDYSDQYLQRFHAIENA